MKKLTFALTFLIALTAAISAQAQSDTSKRHGWFSKRDFAGAMQIQATYRKSDLGQLNTILNKNAIPSLPGNDVWLNLSMSHIHKNWLFEDGIGGSFTSTGDRNPANGIRAKYNQFQFYTRAAYNISENKNFRLYPFVGINLSEAMLRIQDDTRTQSTSDFSTELLNQTASKTIWNPRFGFEFGAGFDYLIKMKPKQMDRYTIQRNIPIGFRAGYYLQATNSNWKIDDNYNLNNGPSNKQSAVFLTFNIGLGYEIKK
jgi:opacity protein-like surface antigen